MAARSSKKKRKNGAPAAVVTGVAEMKEAILQMESSMTEAAALAATEIGQIDEIRRGVEENVARLEAQVREKENMLRQKSSALEELETRLTALGAQLKEQAEMLRQKESALGELRESSVAQSRDLENQIRRREDLLKGREAEIADLRSQLDGLQPSPKASVTLSEGNAAANGLAASAGSGARGKAIGQSMRDVVTRPGKTVQREASADPKKSRLVTLLALINKRN